MMGKIKSKILESSGSFNYYKNHYENLKKQNKSNLKKIQILNNKLIENDYEISNLKNKIEKKSVNQKTDETLKKNRNTINLNNKLIENFEYTFSILIYCYDCEEYIIQSIESVINQTIDFQNNIQLILVNDGCNSYTTNILLEYHNKYPNNIQIISHQHLGKYISINNELKNIKGKYVNFLDSNDYLSPNALEESFLTFQDNENINIACLPIRYFGKINSGSESNNKFDLNKDIINLDENPLYPQISLSSIFLSSNIIRETCFDNNLGEFNDVYFVNRLLLNNKNLGLIRDATYYSRKHFTSNSNQISTKCSIDHFINFFEKIMDDSVKEHGKIDSFVEHLIIYYLKEFITNEEILNNKDKIENFKMRIKPIIDNIDQKAIGSDINIDHSLKSFLLFLKNEDKQIKTENKQVVLKTGDYIIDSVGENKLFIKDIIVKDSIITIYGDFNSYFSKEYLNIKLIKENPFEYKEQINCEYIGEEVISYLNVPWKYTYQFKVSFTVEKNKEANTYFKVDFMKNEAIYEYYPNLSYKSYNKILESNSIVVNPYLISLNDNNISFKKGFNFSIIIAIYNTGSYLYETLDSVINQTLDFEDNVELILVDDGSEDNSLDICYEYKEKYPNNIVVLSQENSGQAIARNNGLEYARGKYVNFLDSDDYISKNTLEEVLRFFDNHESEIDMLAIPIKMFERLNNYHILQQKFHRTRIIDLKNEANNPQLSASSAFFKRSLFPKFKFAENMITSEDSMMINKILLEKQKYGVINTVTYYYRKRFDSSSTIDNSINKKEFYTEKLENYFLALMEYSYAKLNEIPLFIQYLIAYDIQWVIKEADLSLLSEEEKEKFNREVKEIASYLSEEVVIDNPFITNDVYKHFFLSLINKRKNQIQIKDDTLVFNVGNKNIDNIKKHSIYLDIVEIKGNYLNISGFLNSYFNNENIVIYAVKEDLNGNIIGEYPSKYVEYTVRENIKFLEKDWQFKYNFDLCIPIVENEKSIIKLSLRYFKENMENYLLSTDLNIEFKIYCRLSKKSNYLIKDSHILTFHDNLFELEAYRYKKMRAFESKKYEIIEKDKVFDYKNLIKLIKVYSVLYHIKRKYIKKPIYLFMDRTNKGDDNAEHLFKYAVNQKDNILKFFVVGDDDEYKRIKKTGKTVKYNSFKHRLIYLLADKVISSHPDEYVLNPFFEIGEDQRKYVNNLISSETYFLQHGVTLGNVSDWLRKFDKNLSLLVSISDIEHDSFLETGYNYDENIIQTLGFPRYDNLSSEPKKKILIIPTWRNYLEKSEEIFVNSSYYRNIQELLNNEEMINHLKEEGYEIIFKPHPRLENKIPHSKKKFIELFDINENIEISYDKSYQNLFKESNVLITDYSSVAFDFAYLKKPIIYFQPDDDYHHGKGYFDFETMGFGEVIKDKESLLEKLYNYIESDCVMEGKYVERVNKFFKYNDKNNCQRVYDWIKKH